MTNIELLIKISEEKYNIIKNLYNTFPAKMKEWGLEAIRNGTPLQEGHWIIKGGKEQGYDINGVKTWYIQIMCNECGFIKKAIEGHIGQYHYCPNCGLIMIKPQEESEG